MNVTKIGWIGLGKLGLPCALIVEALGEGSVQVVGCDANPRVAVAVSGRTAPWTSEPGVDKALETTELLMVDSIRQVVEHTDGLVFTAVQTPHDPAYGGEAPMPGQARDFDYTALCTVAREVNAAAEAARRTVTLVVISTALPGTMRRRVAPLLGERVRLVYNPYFPAMGSAMRDFAEPEFVLVGGDDTVARAEVEGFYRRLYRGPDRERVEPPILTMPTAEAELTKVAYNTFISMKIVFANAVQELCDTLNLDVDTVTGALGHGYRRLMSDAYLRGGVGDGGACFPPGETVITENGPRAIETIQAGDRVLTLDGTLQPVIRTWCRDYDGDLVEVQAEGLPPARMTADHPVMARLDLRERYANGRKRTANYPRGFPRSELAEVAADDLTTDHLVTWPVPQVEPVERPDHATDEYVELAGWYLSEGSAELNERRRGRLRFDLHLDEQAEGERIAELLAICAPVRVGGRGANAKITIEIKPDQHRRSVRLGSMGLARQLVSDFGKLAAGKTIPAWALWGDEKTAALILRGMILGDGHINDHGVAFSTISRDLAWGAFTLITRLGIRATLRDIPSRIGANGQRHRRAYEVRVRNRPEARRLAELVGLPFTAVGVHEVQTDNWRPVRKLSRTSYRGPVHNLWVAGTNTFVVACGAVHNCHPRDLVAMAYLSETTGNSADLWRWLARAREAQSQWLADVVLGQSMRRPGMPVVVLGKAYKPETDLTAGSPAFLLVHQLREQGVTIDEWWDPYVDGGSGPFDRPAVFVIMTAHEAFADAAYPRGSVIVDPFRHVGPREGVELRQIGRRRGGRTIEKIGHVSGPR